MHLPTFKWTSYSLRKKDIQIVCIGLNTFKRSHFYQSCQIVEVFFLKRMAYFRNNCETRNAVRNIYPPPPGGDVSFAEDFRTLIACFINLTSNMKKRPARINSQGLSAGYSIYWFKCSWYMWEDDNMSNPNRKYS